MASMNSGFHVYIVAFLMLFDTPWSLQSASKGSMFFMSSSSLNGSNASIEKQDLEVRTAVQLMRRETKRKLTGAREERTSAVEGFLCKKDAITLRTDEVIAPRHVGITGDDFVGAVHHFLRTMVDLVDGTTMDGGISEDFNNDNDHAGGDDDDGLYPLVATFVNNQLTRKMGDEEYAQKYAEWQQENKAWEKPGVPPAAQARFFLETHMLALRHAWVALNSLKGEEAKQQQDRLRDLYNETYGFRNMRAGDLLDSGEDDGDAPNVVNIRWQLVKKIKKVLTTDTVHSMLQASRHCIVPHDSAISSLRQRSRIRPKGPLTRDSYILLSKPDGSVSEENSLRMPLVTLGTGYADCYKGRAILYKESGDQDAVPMLGEPGSCQAAQVLPKAGFYKTAVQMGYKAIDTAFIYGTEKQIGAELSGTQDIFITTKTMTPEFRTMLGVQHGTDKVKDQLDDLQRDSVSVLYSHHEGMSRLLEDEVDKGHTQALGTSDPQVALDHEWCVEAGHCKHHVSLIQVQTSYCGSEPMRRRLFGNASFPPSYETLLGNVTFVAHEAVLNCLYEPVMERVAKRLGRTVPQLSMRLMLEQGIPLLVQTTETKHLQENLDVFNVEMSSADLGQLALISEIYADSDDLFQLQSFL